MYPNGDGFERLTPVSLRCGDLQLVFLRNLSRKLFVDYLGKIADSLNLPIDTYMIPFLRFGVIQVIQERLAGVRHLSLPEKSQRAFDHFFGIRLYVTFKYYLIIFLFLMLSGSL